MNHPGGAETTLLRLLSRLAARGWGVTLTTPGEGTLHDQARRAGYEWRPLALGGLAPRAGARAIGSWRSSAKPIAWRATSEP